MSAKSNTEMRCQRLGAFIKESLQNLCSGSEAYRNAVDFLLTSAANGDCQFNRRCRHWDDCPMSKQVLKRPCGKFFTAPQKDCGGYDSQKYSGRKSKKEIV